ncbi:membrane protein insertion efficiency factor YidD [Microbacterium radiodurans]|nr:membrane protein insertion efficiency factor YidD [Microbacterium radiodurans]
MSWTTLPAASTGDGRMHAHALVRSVPLLPRNLGISVLHVYRSVISPLYGDVCKYYPSCSAYAVGAVQQHGLIAGTARTAARLARCHPWAAGGVDDVPSSRHFRHKLTRHGFVVPMRKD